MLEYLVHFAFKTAVMPWLGGESRAIDPPVNDYAICRYSRRLYYFFGIQSCSILLLIPLGLMRFGRHDGIQFAVMMACFFVLASVPLLYVAGMTILFNDDELIIRRFGFEILRVALLDIVSATRNDLETHYLLRSRSGENIRISRLIRGIDIMIERINGSPMAVVV